MSIEQRVKALEDAVFGECELRVGDEVIFSMNGKEKVGIIYKIDDTYALIHYWLEVNQNPYSYAVPKYKVSKMIKKPGDLLIGNTKYKVGETVQIIDNCKTVVCRVESVTICGSKEIYNLVALGSSSSYCSYTPTRYQREKSEIAPYKD